ADGEGEDALCDSNGESGGCFGEVVLEPHLAFEVGEDALDYQSRRGQCALAAEVGGRACPVGCEQPDVVGGQPLAVGAAQGPLSAITISAAVPVNRSASGSYSFSFAGTIV